MTRHFLRVSLAALALFLTVAGSVNLRHTNAASCPDVGCHGGTRQCADMLLTDGTFVRCYND